MAVQQQIDIRNRVHIHLETTNKSFLEMHYYLKAKGIKNNAFFLSLYDTDLIGVDPFDPNLTSFMKGKILRECMLNYWYWLRECAVINEEGATRARGKRFQLHRGNLAMNFLSVLNKNVFCEMPRQHGKTTAAIFRYLWIFNFGTTNSQIMFIHKNHDGSKENLATLKEYRESLPSYLRMDSVIGIDGKRLKVPNTVEMLEHPTNKNQIKTLPSARNKALANTLGRGCTQPLQYYDEFGWIIHNQLIYDSATPAYSRASQNAKEHGAPYGIFLTTTPGDLTTKEGEFAYSMRNDATPWQEDFYDFTYDQIEAVCNANQKSSFFHIKYTYQQLGSGEEYFTRMVKDLHQNWSTIRREILLEWSDIADDCPFTKEDLDIVQQFCKPPMRVVMFGPYRQYQMLIYQEMDSRHGQLVGVDVAGGFRRDSSAITVVDATTTEVCATLNCNYMPTEDLSMVIYELITKYLPNALVMIEKNGIGIGVISRLIHTSIKRNIFYTIKDRVLEERSNGVTVNKGTHRVKAYGIDNTGEVRARMIEILFSRMQYHKDKFIAQILHDELAGLIYKTSSGGRTRVDHSVNTHDDQIFSYLMTMYVWYDCTDLTSRFGIIRGEIKTDDDVEEKLGAIEDLYGEGFEEIEIDVGDDDEEEDVLSGADTRKILADASKPFMTNVEFEQMQYRNDMDALQAVLRTPQGKAAVEKAYNIDLSEAMLGGLDTSYMGTDNIPGGVFNSWYADDDEVADKQEEQLHGNLYSPFMSLDDF